MPWLGWGCVAADRVGRMTTGDGGGSRVTLGGGAASKEGVRVGSQEAVAPVASWR